MNRALLNTGWILTEKVMFALAGIFINVYVARYLGPDAFGLIGFSMAIVALISPLVKLGSENVVFNRLVRNQPSGLLLLETSGRIRALLFACIALLLTVGALFYFESREAIIVFCILLWGSFFTANDIFAVFFNALLNAKFNTLAGNIALAIGVVLKLVFIKFGGSVIWFASANVAQWAVSYAIKWRVYRRQTRDRVRDFNGKSRRHTRHLLKVGLPLAISSISIAIYTRTDQIMLGAMVDQTHVGYYSAALTLSQGWMFLPMAIITSYMVRINEAARHNDPALFDRKVRKLFAMVLFITLGPAIFIGVLSEPLVELLYGADYAPAAMVLSITVISSVFSGLGTAAHSVITVLGGYGFLLRKMIAVSLLNIGLNYLLIPQLGLTGAALSTLCAEILSAFVLNLLYSRGRIFRLQLEVLMPHKLRESLRV
ncbi:O-antigen/teichoic acid export membrane protein [Kushneria sinocarnis]|uniref:O-antigen/teichoic acid export membrane protein n=1 Tax=Kushneria sinocarnis TaxID=595502 RepID=A0A420WWA0_9GAMM|nr:flippase [Kushneria sinocarnis]RKR03387.1 O-antigen/teichoic acid export membrane protein [Kushneria sinocarnis]